MFVAFVVTPNMKESQILNTWGTVDFYFVFGHGIPEKSYRLTQRRKKKCKESLRWDIYTYMHTHTLTEANPKDSSVSGFPL